MNIATLTLNPALDVTTQTPMLSAGHKLRCTAPSIDPGGGGINVARALHALGGSATAIFPAGGPVGEHMVRLLERAGVPTQHVAIGGHTRESFTVDEVSTGRQYRFVLPGPTLSEAEYTACLERVADLDPRPDWLVASGSIPPGVPDTVFLTLGRICRASKIELVLDSSGTAFAKCDQLDCYFIKPSLKELEALAGRELPDQPSRIDAARALQKRGFARSIAVSLGSEGAILVTPEEAHWFAAPAITASSTVGAGDSMVAGIMLMLARGRKLVEAVRYGVAAGAAALTEHGTALARRETTERLLGRVAAPLPLGQPHAG